MDSGHVRGTATTNQHLTGFWRIGGDNLGHWPGAPTSAYFKGSIDEVAVYPTALSASAVHKHYTVGVITPAAALLSAPSTKARAAVAAGVGAPAPTSVGATGGADQASSTQASAGATGGADPALSMPPPRPHRPHRPLRVPIRRKGDRGAPPHRVTDRLEPQARPQPEVTGARRRSRDGVILRTGTPRLPRAEVVPWCGLVSTAPVSLGQTWPVGRIPAGQACPPQLAGGAFRKDDCDQLTCRNPLLSARGTLCRAPCARAERCFGLVIVFGRHAGLVLFGHLPSAVGNLCASSWHPVPRWRWCCPSA